MAVVEIAGQDFEPLERCGVVVERPRLPEPPFDLRTVALGEVVEHVPFFVALMPTSA